MTQFNKENRKEILIYKNNNFKKLLLKSLLSISILSSSLYSADDRVLLENAWINIGYSNAKDAMLSGATTATSKGYSALFTNPAGLSTNYALGLYLRTGQLEHKNSTGATEEDSSLAKTSEVVASDNLAIGIFYKYLLVESKANIHNALGLAYGFETNYGLFSLGFNYVIDATSVENYKDFGTGDYQTVGLQWQKSFVGIDDFYAFYFGFSKKGQGISKFEGENIYRVSPLVQRIGFGFETNVFTTTALVTYDITSQSWHHLDDTLDTTALGLKWMIFDGFSVALGMSQSEYTTKVNLKENSTISFGLEFAAWSTNIAIAALQKEVLDGTNDVYIQENSIHADISFAF
ncbi:MAG: hypothetical protein KAJ49_05515 [Arcobacteraceae bacterium]|nr:hypothetical protein [Arcobacteraceae bacterium]